MHQSPRILEGRVTRELAERILPAQVVARVPLGVGACALPGEPVAAGEVRGPFEPIERGARWGRPWGTTWFRVSAELPDDLPPGEPEVAVELGFTGDMAGFQAEGAVYVGGRLRRGVHPRRRSLPLVEVVDPATGRIEFLVEAASNPSVVRSFAPTPLGSPHTAGDDPLYRFGGIDLVVVDPEVRSLAFEVEVLDGAMRSLPPGHRRRQRLAAVLERALDALDPADVRATAAEARAELAEGLAARAAPGGHRVSAVGHAHIDTAWLWPLREARRKCARTFANQVRLMEEHPEHHFACSQAQQYAWVEHDHPELFGAIAEQVAAGRWHPVGGMWVEADMNLPSGESLVRQVAHGQRYFLSRFGQRCTEVWIPDVFGYPGNLPQVARAGGMHRFVTQKLSWNKQNRFPHHTFVWEGIDGSEVLAHFPPVDTYNAEVTPGELTRVLSNFADHGWSDHSLLPYGHGDGGGGPTPEMLRRAGLLAGMAELPHLEVEAPRAFFERVEAEGRTRPVPRWRGELYFEMHRGTFTSQARTKVGNRRCEDALREAELWLATLGDDSAAAELDALWKRVLTLQFHDILPGSSIAWVHEEAERTHAEVLAAAASLIARALARLVPDGAAVLNACSHRRSEVVAATRPPAGDGPRQELSDRRWAFLAAAPGLGLAPAVALDVEDTVQAAPDRLANGRVELRLDAAGDVTAIRDLRRHRDLLPPGARGAALTLAPDHPVEFDAWDLEQWTARRARALPPATSVEVVEAGPLVGAVRVRREFGASWVEQTFLLRAGSDRVDVEVEVDWQEREQLLAIDFPLDVRADRAACEVQFGHEHRPTHRSTSWDDAKFEVCAQRWVDLSEPDFGVAVLNDGRHGHAVQDGGIRVSLLRASRYPDPEADRGRHRCTLALLPHGPGLAAVLAEAEALNRPLRVIDGEGPAPGTLPPPVVEVDHPGVQVSAVKLADDGSGDLVVRVWEACGNRVATTVTTPWPVGSAVACDALEESLGDDGEAPQVDVVDGRVALGLRPFRFATLRLRPGDPARPGGLST